MIPALWICKTGLDAQQTNIDVTSHNLTNLPNGLQLGAGAKVVATQKCHTQGDVETTDNSLDVMISGKGFFEVELPDGTTAYTRNGQWTLNDEGTIVTSGMGYVIQPEIQVPENAESITIGNDGTVSVQIADQAEAQVLGQLNISSFINPAGLNAIGENLYTETAASGAPQQGTAGQDGMGAIKQGMLETSNVNVTEELVNLIQSQRIYEMNSKVLSTVDDMMSNLIQRT